MDFQSQPSATAESEEVAKIRTPANAARGMVTRSVEVANQTLYVTNILADGITTHLFINHYCCAFIGSSCFKSLFSYYWWVQLAGDLKFVVAEAVERYLQIDQMDWGDPDPSLALVAIESCQNCYWRLELLLHQVIHLEEQMVL